MSIQDAILSFERSQQHLQTKVQLVRGKLGLPNGTVKTLRPGYDWVRLHGDQNFCVQAYNAKTNHTYNLDVYVAIDPYRTEGLAPYVVMGTVGSVGTSMAALLDHKSKMEENQGAHAAAHELGPSQGRDPINIYNRAIVPLRVQPLGTAAMQVYINPGYYSAGGATEFYLGGQTDAITAPEAGIRCDLVYLDYLTNTVGVTTGTAAIDIYTVPEIPACAAGQVSLAYIQLGPNTTEINEQNIYDMRPFLSASMSLLDHDHSGDAGDGGQLDPTECLTSGAYTSTSMLTADGSGGVQWSSVPEHSHDGTSGQGGEIEGDNIVATGVTDGYVLTANGSSGAAWESVPSGGTTITCFDATSTSQHESTSTSYTDTGLSVSVTVPAGGAKVITFCSWGAASNGSGNLCRYRLYRDSTAIGQEVLKRSTNIYWDPAAIIANEDSVAAGTYTYKLRYYTSSSSYKVYAYRPTIIVMVIS